MPQTAQLPPRQPPTDGLAPTDAAPSTPLFYLQDDSTQLEVPHLASPDPTMHAPPSTDEVGVYEGGADPHPQSASPENRLADAAFYERVRNRWTMEKDFLENISENSWGSAYDTIVEVQVLLRICNRYYGMTMNLPMHNVSTGRDDESAVSGFHLVAIGSCLNGQSWRTWENKLTFFYAVDEFLQRTNGGGEDLDEFLQRAMDAMLKWNVGIDIPDRFLPKADKRSRFTMSPLHRAIRDYMVRPLSSPCVLC
jgi:hypothetical protein